MAVTKAELADILCSKCSLSRQDARDLVDNFFNEIATALVQGEEIKLSGFGNFSVRDKKARPGRNPRTGQEVTISERRVVTFKQGKKLKTLLAESDLDLKDLEPETEE